MKKRSTSRKSIDTLEPRPGVNRRQFLVIGGALSAGAVALAACGSDSKDSSSSTSSPAQGGSSTTAGDDMTTTTAADPSGMSAENDLKLGAFAAGLEVLAVNTYQAALDAAGKGSLGDVPPAVAEYVTTALAHHQAHLDAWNEVLTGAGEDEVTDPPAELEKTVNDKFAKVKDAGGAAKLALELETIAADTYLAVIPMLATEAPIKLAASIQPIDRQHIAVLHFALGEYPVPETFATTDMAVSP